MNLATISMQNKETLVKNIGIRYRDSLHLIKNSAITMVEERSGLYHCFEIKEKIDHILQQLPLEYAFIIQKEFLEIPKVNWYEKRFEEEQYLDYKASAIDAFIHCLYG